MQITIKNRQLQVQISTRGAELTSIKSADGCEYLWQADPAIWEEQAPNLFPYIARMTQGKYVYQGKEYRMPIHGFLSKSELTVKKQTEDQVVFSLESSEELQKIYPFLFALEITYTLAENVLKVSMKVENRDEKEMYFGIGGHPGFRVPLEEGLSFSDYQLVFEEACHPARVEFTRDVFVSGTDSAYPLKQEQILPLSHDLFDDDAIILRHAARAVTLCSVQGTRKVTVRYPDMPIIGFWHMPKMEAPYVCIEPWSSLPSRQGIVENIRQQSDLITLKAQCSYRNNWEIEIN